MSSTRSYGVTDLGPDGISTFFARHRCNRFCQSHWQQPRNVAAYYPSTSGTTMELHREQQAAYPRARGAAASPAPIYEEEDRLV
jgi:hypothetical protein